MASPLSVYTTKELSSKTWPDFEKLFSQKGGWDFCWCMHFQRPRSLPKSQWLPTRAERGVRNRRQKKELVESGRAHGILVYAEGEPVGWCQYGPREELPRFDNKSTYRSVAPVPAAQKLWRISCFVVAKKHRRRGIGGVALRAALESIRKKGGSLVEAFPLIDWEEACRARVRRCGHAPSFGNSSTHGTVSMFEKEGFKVIAPLGSMNVLVRRTI